MQQKNPLVETIVDWWILCLVLSVTLAFKPLEFTKEDQHSINEQLSGVGTYTRFWILIIKILFEIPGRLLICSLFPSYVEHADLFDFVRAAADITELFCDPCFS